MRCERESVRELLHRHLSVQELPVGNRPAFPVALVSYVSAQRGVKMVDEGTLLG